MVKNLPASAGEAGSIPGLERSPGEGNGNTLQYSCLKIHGQRNLVGYSPRGHKDVHYCFLLASLKEEATAQPQTP